MGRTCSCSFSHVSRYHYRVLCKNLRSKIRDIKYLNLPFGALFEFTHAIGSRKNRRITRKLMVGNVSCPFCSQPKPWQINVQWILNIKCKFTDNKGIMKALGYLSPNSLLRLLIDCEGKLIPVSDTKILGIECSEWIPDSLAGGFRVK